MAAPKIVSELSVEEYLATSYHPDREYVDGVVEARNLGERRHSRIQSYLCALFYNHRRDWAIEPLPEQRVQVSAMRYRVPDICVLPAGLLWEDVITVPPLVCIEIFSPSDSYLTMHAKVNDYIQMGISNVWLVDPASKEALVCTSTGWNQPPDGRLTVPGTPISVDLAELFSCLDGAPEVAGE